MMQAELMEKQESNLAGIPVREGKYLTFSLAGEEYGIGILKVKEIIGMMAVTHVPQTPGFVKGVINLRGVGKLNVKPGWFKNARARCSRTGKKAQRIGPTQVSNH